MNTAKTATSFQRPFSTRSIFCIGALLIVLPVANAGAEPFRVAGYRFYKEIRPVGKIRGTGAGGYGTLSLDREMIRHAAGSEFAVARDGFRFPSFIRPVPIPSGEVGERRPEVIFQKKGREGRMSYILRLPPPPEGTEYRELHVRKKGRFETGVTLQLGERPGDWVSAGNRTLYSYRGRAVTTVKFNSGKSRFLRLTFSDPGEFHFPTVSYTPLRSVSEYKSDIDTKDLHGRVNNDDNTSVFLLNNEKRRRLHRLILVFREERYRRPVEVLRREQGSRKFNSFVRGVLSRRRGDKKEQVIDFPAPVSGALKLVIKNFGDRPLTLESLSAYSPLEEMVFELPESDGNSAEGYGSLRVYYGNPYARRPVFDIKRTHDKKLPHVAFEAGAHTVNADFGYSIMEPPLSIWIIRILFYAGLLGLIYPAYRIFNRYVGNTRSQEEASGADS